MGRRAPAQLVAVAPVTGSPQTKSRARSPGEHAAACDCQKNLFRAFPTVRARSADRHGSARYRKSATEVQGEEPWGARRSVRLPKKLVPSLQYVGRRLPKKLVPSLQSVGRRLPIKLVPSLQSVGRRLPKKPCSESNDTGAKREF